MNSKSNLIQGIKATLITVFKNYINTVFKTNIIRIFKSYINTVFKTDGITVFKIDFIAGFKTVQLVNSKQHYCFNQNCINTKFKIELYTGYKGYLDYLYIKPTLLQYIEPTLL